ncbi:MAG: type II toxin-antitoxin system HicB family antitoxin [Caulobacteraceae bacterium]|nr:type II toxin-antitoxin system HicB family antitoxin [Caulobacteraceae bacterium]
MQTMSYPVAISEEAPGDFVATFQDIPEAITGGATREEALANAADALATAVEGYLLEGREVPPPTPNSDRPYVALDPAVAARVLLAATMAEQHLSKVALAARLGQDEKSVRRMLTGKGASLDRTLAALRALGVRPALSV